MLPVNLKQDWFMAKINLKNTYLTIPVESVHYSLLSFQVQAGKWIQFQCLPFGLCTTAFVFSNEWVYRLLSLNPNHIIIKGNKAYCPVPASSED